MTSASLSALVISLAFAGRLDPFGAEGRHQQWVARFSTTATVAAMRNEYIVDHDAVLTRLRELHQNRQWKELIEQFERDDFSAWPAEMAKPASEALLLRGQAYTFLKNGKQAEIDLKAAVKLAPRNELIWLGLADNYAQNLNDDQQALAAYRQVFVLTGKSNGWAPISATLASARILTDQVKTDEALAVLQQYGEMPGMPPVWRIKMLRAYGHVYAAQGQEAESLAKFREALALETQR